MSAAGIPISLQAPELRIMGATMSAFGPRLSACTGPTVAASSPVPSHAFEITPCFTNRLSATSISRVRTSPA